MVPGIGGGELVVIAVVALIVVGPKDLPKMLRQLGRFVGKMRNMADEFRSSFEDMARQSELDDLRKEVDALRSGRTPIIEDVSNQMRAIESDINTAARSPVNYVEPVVDAPPVVEVADPQMMGQPPKEPTVKKPRARKAAPAVEAPVAKAPRKKPAKKVTT